MHLTLENAMKLFQRINDNSKHFVLYGTNVSFGVYEARNISRIGYGLSIIAAHPTPEAAIQAAAEKLGVWFDDLLQEESETNATD